MKDAKHILTEALSERTAANPQYSLRAFARDLEMSPQQLSNFLNGRRGISPGTANRIANLLDLDSNQKELFCESLNASFAPSKTQKIVAKAKLASLSQEWKTRSLEIDAIKAISNWHHLALVELIKISRNKSKSSAWFAEKLGLPENEIKLALGRLERLELISKTAKGYTAELNNLVFDKAGSPEAVKNFHKQILEKSAQAMAFQTSDERYGSSSTLPVKVKSVERAKKLIQKFRSDFIREISDHNDGEEIYSLSMQFFRLTQKTKKDTEV